MALTRRADFERQMDEELRFHLDSRVADLARGGMPMNEARRRARAEFGNSAVWQERCRDSRGLRPFDDLQGDLRYAVRSLRRKPLLCGTVLLTQALSIGALTAIFTVVNAVLLRPLPFPDPDRLVMIFSTSRTEGRVESRGPAFGPDYLAWRQGCTACASVGASAGTWPANLTGGAESARVRVARVTPELFETLSVRPAIGRVFLPGEQGSAMFATSAEAAAPPQSVILSDGLWRRAFGADEAVVGRTLHMDDAMVIVVGVMQRGFTFPDDADAWVPAAVSNVRDNAFLRVVARLAPGATIRDAQTSLTSMAQRLAREAPASDRSSGVNVVSLHEFVVGDARQPLLTLLGAVTFVLLIACANIATLLLAHGRTRAPELALRVALGAGKFRIARLLLTEGLVLSLTGGILGVLLAYRLVQAIAAFVPLELPRLTGVSIDGWVLAVAAAVCVLTGVLFGIAPAGQAMRVGLHDKIKETARALTFRGGGHALLLASEVALALVLLIGAGLMLKSFRNLRATSLGFDPSGVLVATVSVPPARYGTTQNATRFFDAVLTRLSAQRGVAASSAVSAIPLGRTGVRIQGDLLVQGETSERVGVTAAKIAVAPAYFRALAVPLTRGRDFQPRDDAKGSPVAIVSESLAHRLWPGQDAVGKRLNIGFRGESWREVVGVAGDVKQEAIGGEASLAVYEPLLAVPPQRRWMVGDVTLVLRTTGDPGTLAPMLRSVVEAVDPALPLYDVAEMNQIVSAKIADPRFYTFLFSSFSLLALLLATTGVYGAVFYSVSRRTHEIGVRLALGASPQAVLLLMIREGMRPVIAGLALGLLGAYQLTHVLRTFVYDVSVTDPVTFAIVSFALVAVAVMACYVPARAATTIDPLVALRTE